jgi:hypothetical protein
MALETATYIDGLVETNPLGTDPRSAGDDHIRLIKTAVKSTFPNVTGAVTPTQAELNYVDGVTGPIQSQLDAKVALTGTQTVAGNKTFSGNNTHSGTNAFSSTVTGPSPAQFDSSTKLATTAFVQQAGFHFQNVGGIGISSNRTMAAAEAGRWAQVGAPGGLTVTLPPLASVLVGAAYTFTAIYDFTLACSGTDQVSAGPSLAATYAVLAGQTLAVVANGTGAYWYVVLDGFGANSFSHNLATNGHQYLPGGRLEQWGTQAVNTDIPAGGLEVQVWFGATFPNAVHNCVATIYNYASFNNIFMTESALTTSYVKYWVYEGSSGVQSNWGIRWRAIGK